MDEKKYFSSPLNAQMPKRSQQSINIKMICVHKRRDYPHASKHTRNSCPFAHSHTRNASTVRINDLKKCIKTQTIVRTVWSERMRNERWCAIVSIQSLGSSPVLRIVVYKHLIGYCHQRSFHAHLGSDHNLKIEREREFGEWEKNGNFAALFVVFTHPTV